MKDIKKDIAKASKKHSEFRTICSKIALKAKNFIDFTDVVDCDYIPADGLCIIIDSQDKSLPYTVPVSLFFEMVKKYGKISEDDITSF